MISIITPISTCRPSFFCGFHGRVRLSRRRCSWRPGQQLNYPTRSRVRSLCDLNVAAEVVAAVGIENSFGPDGWHTHTHTTLAMRGLGKLHSKCTPFIVLWRCGILAWHLTGIFFCHNWGASPVKADDRLSFHSVWTQQQLRRLIVRCGRNMSPLLHGYVCGVHHDLQCWGRATRIPWW